MERDQGRMIDAGTDSDSSGFEIAGETFSVDSTITSYRIENGRRYHAYREGTYWCPNDDRQNENLDIRVLDVGTGTGIWAIDFADEYSDTAVLGTDLSPIQPSMVPPNCMFEIDDARDEWTYPTNYLDFVHIRSLLGSIDDWGKLYRQAYDHLKPGAYIEQVEISIDIKSDDGTVKPDSAVVTFAELFTEAGELTGQTFRTFDIMKKGIEDAGFVNLVERVYKIPIGEWPADPKLRELGQWALLGFDVGLEGYSLATLTRVMGWNTVEIHVLLAQIRAQVRDRMIHTYHEIKVVYAQKPPIT